MAITIHMAGMSALLIFEEAAQSAIPICEYIFDGFIRPDVPAEVELTIAILEPDNPLASPFAKHAESHREISLPLDKIAESLPSFRHYTEDFPLDSDTICTFYINGILLFSRKTRLGRIYLFGPIEQNFGYLYRLLWIFCSQWLGQKRGCFIHAAALVKHGEGYLFLGDSGAGKSTVIDLCPGFEVYSDDAPILRKEGGQVLISPSPFHQLRPQRDLQKELCQQSAQLHTLFFLHKDRRVYLKDIPENVAIAALIKRHVHFFYHLSTEARTEIFELIFDLCKTLPLHELHFAKDQVLSPIVIG